MQIISETPQENGDVIYEFDLTDKEEKVSLEVGTYLVPNETDKEKIIEAAIEYWIVLGALQEIENG